MKVRGSVHTGCGELPPPAIWHTNKGTHCCECEYSHCAEATSNDLPFLRANLLSYPLWRGHLRPTVAPIRTVRFQLIPSYWQILKQHRSFCVVNTDVFRSNCARFQTKSKKNEWVPAYIWITRPVTSPFFCSDSGILGYLTVRDNAHKFPFMKVWEDTRLDGPAAVAGKAALVGQTRVRSRGMWGLGQWQVWLVQVSTQGL